MARRIDTAPRRPTHEMNAISDFEKPNGQRQSVTASGRATKMSTPAVTMPGSQMSPNCEGIASSPSSRNMTIWLSQVSPSWKRLRVGVARVA